MIVLHAWLALTLFLFMPARISARDDSQFSFVPSTLVRGKRTGNFSSLCLNLHPRPFAITYAYWISTKEIRVLWMVISYLKRVAILLLELYHSSIVRIFNWDTVHPCGLRDYKTVRGQSSKNCLIHERRDFFSTLKYLSTQHI